jgi:hypothetical protein
VTEDKLGELPDDIRGYVQQTRVGNPATMAIRLGDPWTGKGSPQPVPTKGMLGLPAPAGSTGGSARYRVTEVKKAGAASVDSKLDQILKVLSQKEDSTLEALQKEVKQLHRELEELRKEKK